MEYWRGQAQQDKFVLNVLKRKRDGFFLEIGSNHPHEINNSYLAETQYGWKGIMIEFESRFLPMYKEQRKNSIHIIQDATTINYADLLKNTNAQKNIDYLQIDLEANNGSTINTLKKLDNEIMSNYTFSTVTFEHDRYHTNYGNTRLQSRKIFEKRGYYCVFEDINNCGINPYEDWYVYPSTVDMNYVEQLQENNKKHYKNVTIDDGTVLNSINWQDIEY